MSRDIEMENEQVILRRFPAPPKPLAALPKGALPRACSVPSLIRGPRRLRFSGGDRGAPQVTSKRRTRAGLENRLHGPDRRLALKFVPSGNV